MSDVLRQVKMVVLAKSRTARMAISPAQTDLQVAAFPKSGGSWLAAMAGELSQRLVRHHHEPPGRVTGPTIYLLRDGRDVVISLFFHHVRHATLGTLWASRVTRYMEDHLGETPKPDSTDLPALLPAFISSLSRHPFGALLSPRRESKYAGWSDHVEAWLRDPGVKVIVRYEDLVHSCSKELRRISDLLELNSGAEAIQSIAEKHAFVNASGGRPRGDPDVLNFHRRADPGEWREVFTREAAETFEHHFGSGLRLGGYEQSADWIQQVPREQNGDAASGQVSS